jgi:hypothetical protein
MWVLWVRSTLSRISALTDVWRCRLSLWNVHQHPAQTLQMLLADQIWSWLEAQHPQVLGDLNPFNEHIAAKFGSQGGY